MQKLVVLNTREKRKILDALSELYGFSGKIEGAFFVSTKQKIFLLSPDIAMLDKSQERALRIDKAGLYIGRVEESGGIRLSIEGSQIIGPYSSKHLLEISEEHLEPWVKGEDFGLSEQEKEQVGEEHGFFIIKFQNDYLGCGQVKNNNVRSLVSKDRRLKVLNR
jgi:NOL1/NOP2/fmu family ribosome biogenesis protein